MKLVSLNGMLFVRHWGKWYKADHVGKEGVYYRVNPKVGKQL